ncbi:UNVERIFIED_CONTAM: hypothetical protein HDU68_009805 [Siphonaria sp. JEL0065]|nr:hypothetical protein HDU68_009805 [Siphonaria sp. JEL0065]
MDLSSIFLENLSFRQWIDLIKAIITVEARQRPGLLVFVVTAVVVLSVKRMKYLRLFIAQKLISIAKVIDSRSLPSPKPKLNESTSHSKSTNSTQTETIAPSLVSFAVSEGTVRPAQPLAIAIPKKRHVVAAAQSRGYIKRSRSQETKKEDPIAPLSASTDDFDGGDDVFLDANEPPARARDSALNIAPGLALKLDASIVNSSASPAIAGYTPTSQESTPSSSTLQVQIEPQEPTLLDLVNRTVIGKEFSQISPESLLTSVGLISPYKPHLFSGALNQALFTVLRLEYLMHSGEHKWNFEWDRNEITMHTIPGYPFAVVRGGGIIRGGSSIPEIFAVIRSSNCRKLWDARFDSGTPLVVLGPDDYFSHTIQKGAFPVAARDFVVALTVRRPSRRELVSVSTSVKADTGDIPGVVVPSDGESGRVRGQLDFAGWLLKETNSGVEAVYMVQVDPKGSIPSSVVKLVQNSTPLAISNVAGFLEKEGTIPFVLQVPDTPTVSLTVNTLSFMSESWNPSSANYDLSMEALSPSVGAGQRSVCIPIAIPHKKFHQSGCNAKVSLSSRGGNNIDKLSVKSGVVIGGGMESTLDIERRDTLLKSVVSASTMAVLLVWIEGASEGLKFGIKIHLERGSWASKVYVNGSVASVVDV